MKNGLKWRISKKKGFTLIELVVVIALMALLALIIVPNLTAYQAKADDSKILANMKGVHTAAELVKQKDRKLDEEKIQKLSNNDNVSDLDRVYKIYYVEEHGDTIVIKHLDKMDRLHVVILNCIMLFTNLFT